MSLKFHIYFSLLAQVRKLTKLNNSTYDTLRTKLQIFKIFNDFFIGIMNQRKAVQNLAIVLKD